MEEKKYNSLAEGLADNKEFVSNMVEVLSGNFSLIKKGYKFPMQAYTENMTSEQIKNTKFLPFIEDNNENLR